MKKFWRDVARATVGVPQVVTQSAASPAVSGTGGEDIRLDRAEDMDMARAFLAVVMDEPDTARDTVRDMTPKDRALLSFTLEELSRIVSEEEDFRRTRDRRAARLSSEDRDDPFRDREYPVSYPSDTIS